MAETAVLGSLARIEQETSRGAIANERFIRQLDELRELKEFLFEEKVQFKEEDLGSIDLEELNNLSYSTSGRVPSADEWRTLDEKLSKLASYLSDDLRRKNSHTRTRTIFQNPSDYFPYIFGCFHNRLSNSPIVPQCLIMAFSVMVGCCVYLGDLSRRVGSLCFFRNIGYYEKLDNK